MRDALRKLEFRCLRKAYAPGQSAAERMREAARAAAAVNTADIARSAPKPDQIRQLVHQARLTAIRGALR